MPEILFENARNKGVSVCASLVAFVSTLSASVGPIDSLFRGSHNKQNISFFEINGSDVRMLNILRFSLLTVGALSPGPLYISCVRVATETLDDDRVVLHEECDSCFIGRN